MSTPPAEIKKLVSQKLESVDDSNVDLNSQSMGSLQGIFDQVQSYQFSKISNLQSSDLSSLQSYERANHSTVLEMRKAVKSFKAHTKMC